MCLYEMAGDEVLVDVSAHIILLMVCERNSPARCKHKK